MINEFRIQGRLGWDPKLQRDDIGDEYLHLGIWWKADYPSLDQHGNPLVGQDGYYLYRQEGIDVYITADMLIQYVLMNCWRGQLVLATGILTRPEKLLCTHLYILERCTKCQYHQK